MVVTASDPEIGHRLYLFHVSQVARDQQRPGVRNGVVHRPYPAVSLDVEVLNQLHDGVGIVFPVGVGLQQVEEQVVMTVFRLSVANDAVGYLDFAAAVHVFHGGPVSGEVEEVAGAGQFPQLRGAEVPFQPVQCQSADTSNVHPGANHGENVGIL